MSVESSKAISRPSLLTVMGHVAKQALWAPPAVFAAHYLVTEWVEHEPYVDPVMHFAGGAAIALCFWHFILGWERYRGSAVIANKVLVSFVLTMFVGIAWEAMEYFLAGYRGYAQYWSLSNTRRDLILDAAGAIVLLLRLQRTAPLA